MRSFNSPTVLSEPAFSRAATLSASGELVKFRKKVSVPATSGAGDELAWMERNRSALCSLAIAVRSCSGMNVSSERSIASRGFDPPLRFAAYLNTLRWNCVTSTDPNLLQSPFRAGIRLDPYQLEPLRKALRLPRVNLFIADDVGLGKTIEAGLIARELLLRKKVREIVVACPPSMLLQWRDELDARFGLRFEILDKDYVQNVRRERGFGVNPWTAHSRFLISQRLLIDESYAGPLRDWLGTFRPGSLLILDEAHHAAPSSGQRYAIDSHITRAIRDLAPRFEHRLFLSATPHNGHSNSFSLRDGRYYGQAAGPYAGEPADRERRAQSAAFALPGQLNRAPARALVRGDGHRVRVDAQPLLRRGANRPVSAAASSGRWLARSSARSGPAQAAHTAPLSRNWRAAPSASSSSSSSRCCWRRRVSAMPDPSADARPLPRPGRVTRLDTAPDRATEIPETPELRTGGRPVRCCSILAAAGCGYPGRRGCRHQIVPGQRLGGGW